MIALLLALAPLAVADAREADPIREMAGAYQEPGRWAQIIPVDARHAYVHLYFEGGIGGDLMTEFEEIMTLKGRTLTFRKAGTDGRIGCSLRVRRVNGAISWAAPKDAPCLDNANPHAPEFFVRGGTIRGRQPAVRTRRYPGEGRGYSKTVADWREAGGR